MSRAASRRDRYSAKLTGQGPIRGWIVTGLFVLAVFYTLYVTRELILPIVLALILAFVLLPVVRLLKRALIPTALASAIVVLGLLGIVGYAGYTLSGPASTWVQKSPHIMRDLEHKLRPLKQKVEEVDKAAAQVEKATAVKPHEKATAVQVKGPTIRQMILDQAQLLLTGALIMFFLLYFLLARGEALMRALISVLPSRASKENMIEIADQIQKQVTVYLGAMTLINIGFGALVGISLQLVGIPNPWLWGTLAGFLNFIPYVGAVVMASILFVVALLTFDQLSPALLVPGLYVLLNILEGEVVTPLFLGRRLALSPIAIFLALIFWGWLWGIAGALVAVPLVVIIKIVCDHVRPLMPVGKILGS